MLKHYIFNLMDQQNKRIESNRKQSIPRVWVIGESAFCRWKFCFSLTFGILNPPLIGQKQKKKNSKKCEENKGASGSGRVLRASTECPEYVIFVERQPSPGGPSGVSGVGMFVARLN